MSIVAEPNGARRNAANAAANDDHVGYRSAYPRTPTGNSASETGGWNAYDVWRRLIKEARDRRAGTAFPQQ